MKTICNLIDKIRPDPHSTMADAMGIVLGKMNEGKDIEDQRMHEFHEKRGLPWKRSGDPIPDRRPNVRSFSEMIFPKRVYHPGECARQRIARTQPP